MKRGKKRKLPIRIPVARPTRWHKDKSKYNRKIKHRQRYQRDTKEGSNQG